MKIDTYFLTYLARDLDRYFHDAKVTAVFEDNHFFNIDTSMGGILISIYQPFPIIGRGILPTDHKNKKLTDMIANLHISTVDCTGNDRIIRIQMQDRLGIMSRMIVVELIPNYATLLVLENGRIIYASRENGAGKRTFIEGQVYHAPEQTGNKFFHPQREYFLQNLPESARNILFNHLKRTDLKSIVVGRDLAWPSPAEGETALDIATIEISKQIESYLNSLETKSEKKEKEGTVQREEISEQEEAEKIARLKRLGQALLSVPVQSGGIIHITDWTTGETMDVDITGYADTVDAATSFFEKARRLEKKAIARKKHNVSTLQPHKEPYKKPFKRIIVNDMPIYIGLSAAGNDFITFSSSPKHWWFHVKDGTGAHVVVRAEHITEELLYTAAQIAAFHSSKKDEPKVEVVYTQIKNVSRHHKNKKGLVNYKDYTTILVEPMSEDSLKTST